MNKTVVVGEDEAGQRLDVFVAAKIRSASRSHTQKFFAKELVSYNQRSAKPSQRLKTGDEIIIRLPPNRRGRKIDLPIIYENDDCLVIDKPSGILSHSKGAFNPEPTVATFIAGRIEGMSGERAGIVHRLDRATSGVMICAKTADSLKFLQKQFAARRVKKHYLAIIEGIPNEPVALIDMPIGRNPKKPQTFRAHPNGKPAQTKYRVVKSFETAGKRYSLIDFEALTGRTHQLRVHAAKLGHPIVGDTFYGGQPAPRLMLHASSLEITLPGAKRHLFKAEPPLEFNNFIN